MFDVITTAEHGGDERRRSRPVGAPPSPPPLTLRLATPAEQPRCHIVARPFVPRAGLRLGKTELPPLRRYNDILIMVVANRE